MTKNLRRRVDRLERRHLENTRAWADITARRIQRALADPRESQELKDKILHYLDLARARRDAARLDETEIEASRVISDVLPERADAITRMVDRALKEARERRDHTKGT